MKYSKIELKNGVAVETNVIEINQEHLSSECWMIQFNGRQACKDCDLADTGECGGQKIRTTGVNEKGFSVPVK